jgi:hypothetical protein
VNWKSKQNPDGGWAYYKGCSWTEPTAFVLLAQSAERADLQETDRECFARGVRFLRSMEGPDGGFRPQPEVRESTWVTAVAALLPEDILGAERCRQAIEWLKGQTGRESGWSYKLQQRLQGNKSDYPKGWPWFPGAAAWVIPTSLGIMAFERALEHRSDSALTERIGEGREYLLSRMCADGGWNHGSSQALGRDGDSYPETTGIALAALKGLPATAHVEKAKAAARRHLATCVTAEGIAWLRIGLAAHGEKTSAPLQPVCRTTLDEALTRLTETA